MTLKRLTYVVAQGCAQKCAAHDMVNVDNADDAIVTAAADCIALVVGGLIQGL